MQRRHVAALAAALAISGTLWGALNPAHTPPDAALPLKGLSVSPFRAGQEPEGAAPSRSEIDADLARLAPLTQAIRTYAATGAHGRLAERGAEQGFRVTAGAWLGPDPVRNWREVTALIAIARRHPGVERLVVGNEALLRGDVTVAALIAQIERTRTVAGLPVSTAEPWHVWLAHPELATAVDFLGVHVLPYWEGIPADRALDYIDARLDELRAAYPGKPIVLTEIGWPSDGPAVGAAAPSRVAQARLLRDWTRRAADGPDYFVIEAFDQPWKTAIEGSVGPYWGVFDAGREAKFAWAGPVVERPWWPWQAGLALLLGLVPGLLYARARARLGTVGVAAFALGCQGFAALAAWAAFLPADVYTGGGEWLVWGVLLAAVLFLLLVATVQAAEWCDVVWKRPDERGRDGSDAAVAGTPPRVSIHLPCRNEPPALVRESLAALAELDYPDVEVIVVDNGTDDRAVSRAIAADCARLGPRFRFIHLEDCPGFKAGALNAALAQTADAAALIAVVDADYVVRPDWLQRTVPRFADPEIGFVQAPQDYRDGGSSVFKGLCHWEYAGFFHIGMVERDRDDSIIQHGTMTVIRRRALEEAGGWAEWCITEDAELGLRLLADGWSSVYTRESLGHGMLPDSLDAYKRQRFRWAYGAVQILKRHRRALWRRGSPLTAAQRYHFVAGWLPWLADGVGLLCTAGAIAWSTALALWPQHVGFPEAAFVAAPLTLCLLHHLRGQWLYARRVPCRGRTRLGAALAGLSLSHTVAKAVLAALVTRQRPFQRTPKGEARPSLRRSLSGSGEEAAVAALLLAAGGAVAATRDLGQADTWLWLGLLAAQALPYAAAVAMALIAAAPDLKRRRVRRRAFAARKARPGFVRCRRTADPGASRAWGRPGP